MINLLRHIDFERFDVSLICTSEKGKRFFLLEDLPLHVLVCDLHNLMSPLKTLRAVLRIRKFLKAHGVRVIHAYMFNPNMLAALVKLTMPGLRLITTRRDMGYWHGPHHWAAWKLVNRITHRVIAVSEEVKAQSMKMECLAEEKIVAIPNGLDVAAYDPDSTEIAKDLRHLRDRFVVGILAMIRPEKRHDLFIEAARLIGDRISNIHYLVVGPGYPDVVERVKQQVAQAGLSERFTFTGDRRDIAQVLKAFDVSVLCSDTEGMSNTLLESIAMGRVVVATRVGGNPEVIRHEDNGLLVSAGKADELAAAILRLHDDRELRSRLVARARQTALEKYDVHAMVKRICAVYSGVV